MLLRDAIMVLEEGKSGGRVGRREESSDLVYDYCKSRMHRYIVTRFDTHPIPKGGAIPHSYPKEHQL